MFKVFKRHEHNQQVPDFSRADEEKSYPFDELSAGDFLEIYVDSDKDWDQEVMFEHDLVFRLNHDSKDNKVFRHQPLRPERIIRIWRLK